MSLVVNYNWLCECFSANILHVKWSSRQKCTVYVLITIITTMIIKKKYSYCNNCHSFYHKWLYLDTFHTLILLMSAKKKLNKQSHIAIMFQLIFIIMLCHTCMTLMYSFLQKCNCKQKQKILCSKQNIISGFCFEFRTGTCNQHHSIDRGTFMKIPIVIIIVYG